MDSFRWDRHFVTGIEEVDEQHRRLVDIINQFGSLLSQHEVDREDIETLFKQLSDYARYHFQEEETMMSEVGIDKRHFDYHVKAHHLFLQEVTFMHEHVTSDYLSSANKLLSFLIHWLAYHILGIDQNMARQVKAIKKGVAADVAYEKEEQERNSTTAPLLAALDGLFHQVSERNKELLILNQSLEAKVIERTMELQEANRHLEELSLTDVLTGLPNRRHAMRRLGTLWGEAVKENMPISCMMIDADHFKEVNDTYGHDAGDDVLCKLAKALQGAVRTDDVVCRLGGDEFFIICPDTDCDGGRRVAEHVHKVVNQLKVPTGDGFWFGSISIGVASRAPTMKNIDGLIKAADLSVYEAKRAGKNCVRSVQES